MQHDMMADRHIITQDRWINVVGDMKDAEVLDVRSIPNAKKMNITTDDRVEPDARVLPDHDIANDDCILFDKGALGNLRSDALKGAYYGVTLGYSTL